MSANPIIAVAAAKDSRFPAVCEALDDHELLKRLKSLVSCERRSVALVLAFLGEIERRRLHESEGFPSLFWYCVRELGYSEEVAYKRVRAALAARRFPSILSLLADGGLTLTGVSILAAHLNWANHVDLLGRANGLSKRDIEKLVAGLAPQVDSPDKIRVIAPHTREELVAVPSIVAKAPSVMVQAEHKMTYLTPERVKISFSAAEDLVFMIERVRDLIRHKHPQARLEDIFREMSAEYLSRHDPAQRIPRKNSRPLGGPKRTRQVPQAVKKEVWTRDSGRCAFVASNGNRCEAKAWLEFDHVRPWALGGSSVDPANIRLLCRTHNQMKARDRFFPPGDFT